MIVLFSVFYRISINVFKVVFSLNYCERGIFFVTLRQLFSKPLPLWKKLLSMASHLCHISPVTECPVFVCVLKGAFVFASDLVRAIDMPNSEIAFIRYKSYSGTESTGQMNKILGLNDDITGREVIIVEDIVDTGLTARALRDDIEAMNPQSVKMATLLFKPASLKAGKAPEYVGFEIPPKFIIGYGLDLDEKVRGLRDIFVLKTED